MTKKIVWGGLKIQGLKLMEDDEGSIICQKYLPLRRTLWTHPNQTDDLSKMSL